MKTRHIAGLIFLGSLLAISVTGMLVTRLGTGPSPAEPGQAVMEQRKGEVIRLVQHWEPELEDAILDGQFYKRRERALRVEEAQQMLDQAGSLRSIGPLSSPSPLQGSFDLDLEEGRLNLLFTLSPEAPHRILDLKISYENHLQDPF